MTGGFPIAGIIPLEAASPRTKYSSTPFQFYGVRLAESIHATIGNGYNQYFARSTQCQGDNIRYIIDCNRNIL